MWWLGCFASILGILFLKTEKKCFLRLPHIAIVSPSKPSLFVSFVSIVLHWASLICLMLAFLHFLFGPGPLERYIPLVSRVPPAHEQSRILFFVVDRSGSMGESLPDSPETSKMELVKNKILRQIDALNFQKDITNVLGLITFARVAKVVVPLSVDRQFFVTALGGILPEREDRYNGSAIGYAVFKTVQLIAACRQFAQKSMVPSSVIGQSIIVITDGIEEPHPEDRNHPYRSMRISQAVRSAIAQKVRVYCINIDKRGYQRLSVEERDEFRKLFSETGGAYIEVTPSVPLSKALSGVIQEEKPIFLSQPFDTQMAYGFTLIVAALFFVILSRLLETLFMRVVR
jgi:Ca-activated chloride channel family protein